MKITLALVSFLSLTTACFAATEFESGTYVCQGQDVDKTIAGTMTFKVSKVTLNSDSNDKITSYYVDAVFQGEFSGEKDFLGLKGLAYVSNSANGESSLILGQKHESLSITKNNESITSLKGVLKLSCSLTK